MGRVGRIRGCVDVWGLMLSVAVVVPVAIAVERWSRRAEAERRAGGAAAVRGWAAQHNLTTTTVESLQPRWTWRPAVSKVLAVAEGEHRGHAVVVAAWEAADDSGPSNTACLAKLRGEHSDLEAVRRGRRRGAAPPPDGAGPAAWRVKRRGGRGRPAPGDPLLAVLSRFDPARALYPRAQVRVFASELSVTLDRFLTRTEDVGRLVDGSVDLAEALVATAAPGAAASVPAEDAGDLPDASSPGPT